jgi:hypothetical protein
MWVADDEWAGDKRGQWTAGRRIGDGQMTHGQASKDDGRAGR